MFNIPAAGAAPKAEMSGEPEDKAKRTRPFYAVLRKSVRFLTLIYTGSLVSLLIGLEWWGERHWLFSLLLFAPPVAFLSPLAILTPACLLLRQWRVIAWQFGCAVFVLTGYMTFRWHSPVAADASLLTLVTHNVGEGDQSQFVGFVKTQDPDVILLQDARGHERTFGTLFPNYHIAGEGEFLCLSKEPIAEARLLQQPSADGLPVAARFRVTFRGTPLTIYNVRLPTPRAQLRQFRSRQVLLELLHHGEKAGEIAEYRKWLAARIALAQALAETLGRETQTYIAAGDFNTPDHGFIYRMFSRRMVDSFKKAGRGWGLTFPDGLKEPRSLLAPWLRIDYVFAGRGVEPVFCVPEPGKNSQHHAVMARLRVRATP